MSDEKDGGLPGGIPKLASSDLPLNSEGKVDVDKIRLKLLIICRAKPLLDTVANYLIRRGWETMVTRDIKDAFKHIATFKPDFVLVSVNIQSPKIVTLPTIIYHTFKVPVITFGESLNTRTLKGMQSINANYKMPGALSGPSVHRRIKQILQELYVEEARVEAPEEVDSSKESIVVSGNKNRKVAYQPKARSEEESEGEDSGPMIFEKGGGEKGGGTYIAKGEARKHPNSKEATSEEIELDDTLAAEEEIDEDLDLEALAAQYGKVNHNQEQAKKDLGKVITVNHGLRETKKGENFQNSTGEKTDLLLPDLNEVKENNLSTKASGQATAGEVSKAENTQGDEAKLAVTKEPIDLVQQEKARTVKSAVFETIEEIAKQSVLPVANESAAGKTQNECTVISLKFADKSTYILVFVDGAVHDEIQYISRFQANLNEQLPLNIENVEIRDPVRVHVELDQEKFKGINKEESFSFTLNSGMGQVHVYILHSQEYKAKITFNADEEKALIESADLTADMPPGVDVFLHLPKNNKHYLYLKPNSSIDEQQKQRLIERQAKVFINKEDVETFRETSTRNKTLELIISPKNNKKVA